MICCCEKRELALRLHGSFTIYRFEFSGCRSNPSSVKSVRLAEVDARIEQEAEHMSRFYQPTRLTSCSDDLIGDVEAQVHNVHRSLLSTQCAPALPAQEIASNVHSIIFL